MLVMARSVVVADCSEVSPLTVMFDEKSALRVVVEPPNIVSPVAWVPAPIVEDASAYRPLSNPTRVEVETELDVPNVSTSQENEPPPPLSSSVPQITLPDESVCRSALDAEQSSVAMLRPLPSMTRPLIVDDAVVASMLVTCIPAAKVDVAAVPCTTRNPVVVAPPNIVSPPACVPSPMVEDARENSDPSVARPLVSSVVTPEIAPAVTSHESDAISIWSPPSPMVSVPVVVSVPEIELEPMTPPLSVSASLT